MVTIIHASHRHSYSWQVAKAICDSLKNLNVAVNIIDLVEEDIRYCCGEQVCQSDKCIYKDDFTSHLYDPLLNSDCVYIVSPTYFDMPPARLKNMMDRSNAILPHIDENQKRYFGAWVCGETEDNSIDNNLNLLINFAEICEMQPVDDLMIKEIREQEESCKISLDKVLKIAELIKDLIYSNE